MVYHKSYKHNLFDLCEFLSGPLKIQDRTIYRKTFSSHFRKAIANTTFYHISGTRATFPYYGSCCAPKD